MSEEKKPKIDLKSRLKKQTVAVQGGPSVPPPVGIPKPTGVPLPPFGQEAKKPGVRVDTSDPYAAIQAGDAPVPVKQQAIKIEMSEEVVQAQKKAGVRSILFAFLGVAAGLGIGYLVGGRAQTARDGKVALEGALQLKVDLDKANGVATELADTLKGALGKIKNNKYPEAEVKKLGELSIPFDGMTLAGKGVGRYNAKASTLVFKYLAAVAEANDQKDSVQNVLGGAKKAIEDYLAQKESPKVRWALYVKDGSHGKWASLRLLPEPFAVDQKPTKGADGKDVAYNWPGSFKLPDEGKTYTLKRYDSGDPTTAVAPDKATPKGPQIIPVDPDSQAGVCPLDVLSRLSREVGDLEEALRGNQTPGEEKTGVIMLGDQLGEELGKIGAPQGG